MGSSFLAQLTSCGKSDGQSPEGSCRPHKDAALPNWAVSPDAWWEGVDWPLALREVITQGDHAAAQW